MPTVLCTDIALRAFKPPEKGHIVYWDSSLPGFGLRVSQGGARAFFLYCGHRDHRQRIPIGRYPIISLSKAREVAKNLLAARTLGQHLPPSLKFEEAYEQFKQLHCARKRPRTSKDYQRIVDKYFLPKLRGQRLE